MNSNEHPVTSTNALDNGTTRLSGVPLVMARQPIFRALVTAQATIGVYLFVAMIYSEWKLRSPSINSSQMHVKWLRRVCLLVSCFGTAHLVIDGVAVFTPPSDRSCTLRLAVQKVSYCLGMFSVYGFLWLRQKLFYSNPSLKYLYTPRLRRCSWAVLCIIIVCFICQCIMTVLGVMFAENTDLDSNAEMCYNHKTKLWTTQIILAALSSSLVHATLMGLFLYPLCKHRVRNSTFFVRAQNGSFVSRSSVQGQQQEDGVPTKKIARSTIRESLRKIQVETASCSEVGSPLTIRRSTKPEEESYKKRSPDVGDRLRRLIIRCLSLTVTCVLASLTVTILTVFFYHGGLLPTFLYGANMLVNMICCTGCFNHWCATLFPFCISPKKRKRSLKTSRMTPSEISQKGGRRYESIV